jgi:hypothetical protein
MLLNSNEEAVAHESCMSSRRKDNLASDQRVRVIAVMRADTFSARGLPWWRCVSDQQHSGFSILVECAHPSPI